jgi:hypothetical protein
MISVLTYIALKNRFACFHRQSVDGAKISLKIFADRIRHTIRSARRVEAKSVSAVVNTLKTVMRV